MVQIPDSDLSTTKTYVQEHQVVPAQAWSFYAFNVTEQDYQIVVNLAAEEDSQCEGGCQPVGSAGIESYTTSAAAANMSGASLHFVGIPASRMSDNLVVRCWPLSTVTV